ncbi:MAG: hypothetical protein J6Z04_05360 [Clostridia bacterium]|nr:hypothetical protein [Clostridia bacterium]
MTRRRPVFLVLGWAVSTLPALIATLRWFPLFVSRGQGERAISLLSCLLLVVALVPLRRALGAFFRNLTAWKVYLFLFVFFTLTGAIAHEVRCVAAVGLISSIPGSILFAFGRGSGDQP